MLTSFLSSLLIARIEEDKTEVLTCDPPMSNPLFMLLAVNIGSATLSSLIILEVALLATSSSLLWVTSLSLIFLRMS